MLLKADSAAIWTMSAQSVRLSVRGALNYAANEGPKAAPQVRDSFSILVEQREGKFCNLII